MPRAHPPARLTLADRLLMEAVRLREEAAGHPAPAGEADALAIHTGGSLAQRLYARAAALPEAEGLRPAVQQVVQRGKALFLGVILIAALSGAFTAAAALDAGPPASLPLVLILLVGSNLFMLLLWLLLMAASPRTPPGLGRWLLALRARFAGGRRQGDDPRRPVMALLAGGASGRWLAASLSHAAWLSFSIAALLGLLTLLSVRAYSLSWDTTLLAPETVAAWVRALSFGPALLGASAEQLFIDGAPDRVAGQAGSYWLLAALMVYGVLPRLFALILCAGLWWRAQADFGRDLHRIGFARLRSRLMPDHAALGVVDAAPAAAAAIPLSVPTARTVPRGPVQGLWLDDAEDRPPPDLPGVAWQWRGAVDAPDARHALLATVAASPTVPVVVLVRATMSPDRGAERFVAALRRATPADVQLMLVDMDRLAQRGATACRERVADWQALASRAGLTGGVLSWPQACP